MNNTPELSILPLFIDDLQLQTERNSSVKSIVLIRLYLIASLLIEFARGGTRRRDE
jgi:hypothetical protein